MATDFLNTINNLFKQYLFDNTDFNVFELKNKAEYDRLNKIRVDFIIFMCIHKIIHPFEFIQHINLTAPIINPVSVSGSETVSDSVSVSVSVSDSTPTPTPTTTTTPTPISLTDPYLRNQLEQQLRVKNELIEHIQRIFTLNSGAVINTLKTRANEIIIANKPIIIDSDPATSPISSPISSPSITPKTK
jgi:hypothetical protein